MNSVICVEGLSKQYIITHCQQTSHASLRDSISDGLRWAADRLRHSRTDASNTRNEEFWALKDVNLKIQQGDRVGIIGRNGAGKSTLLKILSRITEPTSGRISITGRVSSLLEVGTGFHRELTGRENIFLNGAILGLAKKEIDRKFDEIVDFAEVEKFLDTPVKHYSSGMYVRLAFAVASNLEPDILIIDEVLAVGDASFQRKCLGKMEDASKNAGRTIVFVSHNIKAIQNLCNVGVLLNAGSVIKTGPVLDTVNAYGHLCAEPSRFLKEASYPENLAKRMQLRRCWIAAKETEFFQVEFKVEVETRAAIDGAYIALDIFDNYNETVLLDKRCRQPPIQPSESRKDNFELSPS